jgi:hypothetical protein
MMLRALLRLLCVNLDRKLAQLHGRFDELTTRAIPHATERAKETGLTVGFILLGAVAALATLIMALAGYFRSLLLLARAGERAAALCRRGILN